MFGETQTWFEQLWNFSYFRSEILKEAQNLLSPNESIHWGKPDWLIIELLDQMELSTRFRLSVRLAIQPLRWILKSEIISCSKIELTVRIFCCSIKYKRKSLVSFHHLGTIIRWGKPRLRNKLNMYGNRYVLIHGQCDQMLIWNEAQIFLKVALKISTAVLT